MRTAAGRISPTTSPRPTNGNPSNSLPRRSRSAPNTRAVGGSLAGVRTLRTSVVLDGSTWPSPGNETENSTLPSVSPTNRSQTFRSPPKRTQQQVYNTWNTLQMGEQSNFLHQAARGVHGILSPGASGGKKGPWSKDEVESISVEETYNGPHITLPVKMENVLELISFYKNNPQGVLHRRYALEILLEVKDLLDKKIPNAVVELNIERGQSLTICGDVHGQLQDVLWIFRLHGYPSDKSIYLFNGDIADRGEQATEIFFVLLSLMLIYPNSMWINRGNHEDSEMNELSPFAGGGFAKEVRKKYGGRTFALFQEIFNLLPLATVVNKELFVVHGGLSRHIGVKLDHIRNLDFRRQTPVPNTYPNSIFFDLLWADPKESDGVGPSRRGPFCISWGRDLTHRFLDDSGLAICIRSHEVPTTLHGYDLHHDQRVITIFSASNYCGSTGNFGAVLKFWLLVDKPPEDVPKSNEPSPTVNSVPATAPPKPSPKSPKPLPPLRSGRSPTARGRGAGRTSFSLQPLHAPLTPHTSKPLLLNKLKSLYCSVFEHWAPTMSELLTEPSNEEDSLQRRASERAASISPRGASKMRNDILEKVRSKVVEKKEELLWQYVHTDSEATGLVSEDEWQQGMSTVLQMEIPWNEYQSDLVAVDPITRRVDYRRFLQRYRIAVAEQESEKYNRSLAYDALACAELSLNETIDIFDGKMSAQDLALLLEERCQNSSLNLNVPKITLIVNGLQSIVGTPGLSTSDLLPLFVILSKEPSKSEKDTTQIVTDALRHLPEPLSCVELFTKLDQDKDGFLNISEFIDGMLDIIPQNINITHGLLQSISRQLLLPNSQYINIIQLTRAFYTDLNTYATDMVMQQLYTLLYENAVTLRRACRVFDEDGDGTVSTSEFREVLGALNSVLIQKGRALTPIQMAIITAKADRNEGGGVKYAEFLDSFEIIDEETPTSQHKHTIHLKSELIDSQSSSED